MDAWDIAWEEDPRAARLNNEIERLRAHLRITEDELADLRERFDAAFDAAGEAEADRDLIRDALAAVLSVDSEENATGSRDFGRGFAHAMRLVREAAEKHTGEAS